MKTPEIFMRIKALFLSAPMRAEYEFDAAILRIRAALADLDNDGTPDALANLMRNVAAVVNLLEVMYPTSGKVKRGGEKLARFMAKLEVPSAKWVMIKYLIEGAVSLRKLST